MNEWKKVILYAIIPAIIAGIFAVAPKLYDEITEPKAVLEYHITKGPMLRTESGHKSIYSIKVINNGKKPLSAINALIKSKGDIEAINTYEDTGLSPRIKGSPPSVIVDTLHPSESFTISLMLVTPNNDNKLSLVLRSKETLGTKFSLTDASKTKNTILISGFASAMSVFVMALYFMLRMKKGNTFGVFNSYKSDIIFYIVVKFGFTDIVNQYGINEGDITYLRFGDMLFAIALSDNSEKENSSNIIIALKSMLLIEDIAESSKKLIIRNIRNLEGDNFSNEEILLLKKHSLSLSNLIELRDSIDKYADSPATFFSSEVQNNK